LAISYSNKYSFRDINIKKETSSWLEKTIREEGFVLGKLQYVFLSDDDLHQINVDFLNHDTYTDIITFDYNRNEFIFGEIYISIDRVEENAQKNHIDFEMELHRILVHGLLHLLGYKDKSPNEKSIMTSKEDYYLSLLP
jgi:rRNA maturation RNase YbeY